VIFVTVGTQLPFDRLIQYMDRIAPDLPEPVFAQTGTTSYTPKNLRSSPLVTGTEFDALMKDVTIIVGHAGIGTLIAAQKHRKPLILVPRLSANAEHRNDHQVATVNSLRHRQGVYVASSETELRALLLSELVQPDEIESLHNRRRLIDAITAVIHS
jgi:UDP-N-acetylglucosamine transferase subunit ALG13